MYAVVCIGPSFDECDEENFHEADLIVKGTQWKRELQEYHQQHRKTTAFHEEIITETTSDGRTIQKLVRTYPGEETETVEEYEAVEIDGKVTSVSHTVTGSNDNKKITHQQSKNQHKQIEQQHVKEEFVTEVSADGRTIQKKITTYPGEVTETIEESEVTQVGDEVTEVKRQVIENKPKTTAKPTTVQSPLDPGKQEVVIVPGHQKVEFDPSTNAKIVTEKTTTGYQQTITTVTAEGLTKTQIKTFFDAVEIPGEETIDEEESVTETTTSTSTTTQSPPNKTKNTQKKSNENVSIKQQQKTDKVDTTNKQLVTIDNQNKALSERKQCTDSSRTTTEVTKTTKESSKSEQSVRIVSSSGSEPITTATASETKVQTSAVSAKEQTKIKQKDGTEKIEEYEETQAKEVKISGQIKMTPTEAIQQCQKTVQLTESVTEKIDDEETTIINEKLETESQNQTIPLSKALENSTKMAQNAIKAITDTTTITSDDQTKNSQQLNEKTKNTKTTNEQTNVSKNTNKVSTNESNTTKVVIVSKIINDNGEEVTEEIRHFPGGREHITKTLRVDGTTKLASKTFYDAVPVEETTTEEITTTTTTSEQLTKVDNNTSSAVTDTKNKTNQTNTTTIDKETTTTDDNNTTKIELVWETTNENGDIESEEIRHFPGGREHITKLLRIDGTTKISSKTFYDEVPVEETTTTEEETTTTTTTITEQNQNTSNQLASAILQKQTIVDNKNEVAQLTDTTKKCNTSNEKNVTDTTTTKIELVWEATNENGDVETEEIRHFIGGREHITKILHTDGTTKISSKTFYDEVPVESTSVTDKTTTTTTSKQEQTDAQISNQIQVNKKTTIDDTTKVEVVWETTNDDGEKITEEIRHFPGGREHITKTLRIDGTTKMSSKTFYDAVPIEKTTVETTEETKKITEQQQSSKIANKNTKATEQIETKHDHTTDKSLQNTKIVEQVKNKNTQNNVAQKNVDQKSTTTSQNVNKKTENTSTDTTTRIEHVSTIKNKNGDVVTEEIRHFLGGREHITKTLRIDGTTKMSSKTFYDSVPVSNKETTTNTSEETKKSTNTAKTNINKGIVSTTDTQIAATTTNTTKIELVSTTTNKDGETTTEHIRHFPGGREHIFKTLRADGSTKCGSSKTVYDAVPVEEGATGNDDEEEEIEEYEEIVEEHSSSSMTKTENTQTTSSSVANSKVDTQTTSTMSTSKVDIETSAKKKLPSVHASKKAAAPAAVKQKEAPTPVPPPRKKEVKKSTKGK